MLRLRLLFCAMTLPLLTLTPPAAADPVVIDFEGFNLGGGVFLDTPQTLEFPQVGGSGVDVTIEGHDDVRIYNLFRYGGADPGANGQTLIDMNWLTYDNPQGTDIYFSLPVMNFSLQAGDFGGDDDSPLTITAFDANQNQIGSASLPWLDDAEPPMVTLFLEVQGIRRIHWQSGGFYRNSMFIDNLTFEPAPPTATQSISWGSLKHLYD